LPESQLVEFVPKTIILHVAVGNHPKHAALPRVLNSYH
jgi:hypothetical protein